MTRKKKITDEIIYFIEPQRGFQVDIADVKTDLEEGWVRGLVKDYGKVLMVYSEYVNDTVNYIILPKCIITERIVLEESEDSEIKSAIKRTKKENNKKEKKRRETPSYVG